MIQAAAKVARLPHLHDEVPDVFFGESAWIVADGGHAAALAGDIRSEDYAKALAAFAVVKTTGDGMLVEFASAVDAVRSASEVQRAMATQNASVPQNQRIEFRIGIHVGDVIVDDDDIFGDGVNIAARLESIAAPGGVCISDDTYRQIRGKVDIACEDLGLQTLKNIVEPMRAWRIQGVRNAASAQPSSPEPVTLPDKPSIAVLPFQNMSVDPEQEYFADGIGRGYHHRIVTIQTPLRDRSKLNVYLQRKSRRH